MCVIEIRPNIETRRLVLRAPEARDAAAIAALANDWNIARMTTRLPHPYALRDAESFLAAVQAQDPRRENSFLIEHEGAGPVGMIGLYHDGRPYPELGYWIGRPFWGRGFATEAAEATLDWARRRWNKRAVVAGHFADNAASGRVLEKAGFLYTGEIQRKHSRAREGVVDTRIMVWLA
jgi:RimJ/RimL family protein N-acetyltransferase